MNYMKRAYDEALKAFKKNEVPVGAIIVFQDKIVAWGHNRKMKKLDVTSHAEIEALKMASKKLGRTNLEGCVIYITLEPCPMCLSAIIQSNIKEIYFGAYDKDSGAIESFMKVHEFPGGNRINTIGGIMEAESSALISKFFKDLRI